jgi:hypothetical protein
VDSNEGSSVRDHRASPVPNRFEFLLMKTFRLRGIACLVALVATGLSATAGTEAPAVMENDGVTMTESPAESAASPSLPVGTTKYVGNWRGKNCTASIEWTAGDGDTLREGTGVLVVEGDMAYSLSGWQPREDYIEFSISPDPSDVICKTTRKVTDGKVIWEGRFLTLTEK